MVQLPQMPTLQDFYDLLGHPLSNPGDTEGLLGEEEAEAGKEEGEDGRPRTSGGLADAFSRYLSKCQLGQLVADGCVKSGHK